ncbi:hypothetical protein PM082_024414 [Marasmius tenuissimus]|nr:hypothetical protein PM082_024414 [Marasmius tenuissimus]
MTNSTNTQYLRRIMVDNTDPRIVYDTASSWKFGQSDFNNVQTFGEPYNQTLTGTNVDKASFTFIFEGEFIQVRGARDSQDSSPQFSCEVDANSAQSVDAQVFGYNDSYATTNLVLCEKGGLTKAQHTLTVNITIGNLSTDAFWLDSVEYSPLDDADLTQRVLRVDWRDFDHCSYSNSTGEWNTLPGDFDDIVATRTPDASMSFKFNGTSKVSVYGSNAYGVGEKLFQDATGTWQIDSGPRVEFSIPGSKIAPQNRADVVARTNQLLFTSQLVEGENEHKMTISYSGPQGTRDLSSVQFLLIDHFFMENNHKLVEPEKRTVPVGATVGGILAGVLGLIAIGGLVWFIRRRRRQKGGPREVYNGRWSGLSPNAIPEVWTGEPLQEPWSPTALRAVQDIPVEPLTPANYAQWEVINGHACGESDHGARYAALHTSNGSQKTATTLPAYTPV